MSATPSTLVNFSFPAIWELAGVAAKETGIICATNAKNTQAMILIPTPPKTKYLQDNFLLTPEMWRCIYDHQKGLCAVCQEPLAEKVPNTDHRHSDGLVRGILCLNCNRAIRENFTIEFVTAILNYLANPPATAALGRPHYGLSGRIGTRKRRKLIKKLKKQKVP